MAPKTRNCILYPRYRDSKGYGVVRFCGKKWFAHRLAYMWATGVDPGKQLVCHHCDTPACVNPAHLFLGSSLDNHRDMDLKGRRVSSERHGRAKLTAEDVRQIRCLLALGMNYQAVAKLFGVHWTTVGCIARGERWKDGANGAEN